ncbi:molybdopterin-dependent oxidoreductase [Myxococcota bacterium]|nr:molybdopterin-dependent oxidoreductase [Myxococcota bacterium]
MSLKVVGTSVRKVDGLALAAGGPLFVADEIPRHTLVGRALRSPHAHAEIVSIDVSAARALPGVYAALSHHDVPRIAITTAGQGAPEPSPYDTFILDKKVRYVGDPVALVAAETAEIAAAALKLIKVEYRPLPAILSIDAALAEGAPVIHDEPEAEMPIPVHYEPEKNICAFVDVASGDIEAAINAGDHVIDGTYEVHYAQHAPIEPHTCAGWLDQYGRLVLRTSTQVPFHARRITARALGLNVRQIRVIKPRVGGGFGTKQEVLLEPWVGALVLAAKRPVMIELDREEELVFSRTRHPQRVRMRTGYLADGALTGTYMEVHSNTGAYGSHGLTVMTNCGSKTLPLYRRGEVAFRGTTVYTNMPVAGAYRGYGGTQASFAQECQMDEIAQHLGVDPLALRQKLHIRQGEGSPAFAMLGEGKEGVEQIVQSCGLAECLKQGAEAIDWYGKRGKPGDGPIKRGIGMAALMQGSSIPEIDMASVTLKMNEDGSFNLMAGATDLGTGSDTVLAQIAAEVLGVSVNEMIVHSSDTDLTPFDVGAYASSTTYLSGEAARRCALKVAAQIAEVAAVELGCDAKAIHLEGGYAVGPEGRQISLARVGAISLYERNQHQIGATDSAISHSSPPPFAAHFVEVEVDTETGLVKVKKYVAAVDCGRAIHPALAEGQVEGSVANGIGYALTERFIFNEWGKVQNGNFGDYRIPSAEDMPELVTILVPTVEPTGPYGAKSVSEININGACPAIANAIYDAIGVRLRQTPFTPEVILDALDAKARG